MLERLPLGFDSIYTGLERKTETINKYRMKVIQPNLFNNLILGGLIRSYEAGERVPLCDLFAGWDTRATGVILGMRFWETAIGVRDGVV